MLNLSGWRERGFYGLAYRVKKDIEGKDLGARLTKTLDYEIDVLEHQFARNGVQTAAGDARFLDPHRIEVAQSDGETPEFEADKIVIAVGTKPYRPISPSTISRWWIRTRSSPRCACRAASRSSARA